MNIIEVMANAIATILICVGLLLGWRLTGVSWGESLSNAVLTSLIAFPVSLLISRIEARSKVG